MGFLNIFKNNSSKTQDILEREGFEISDCNFSCDDCSTKFPSYLELQNDNDGSLWETSTPYGLHIAVPTGKTDWVRDATSVSNTLSHATDKWASHNSDKIDFKTGNNTIKVTVSSLSTQGHDRGDLDYLNEKKGDLLLLPFFVWVRNVTIDNVGKVLDVLIPLLIEYRDQKLNTIPQSVEGFDQVAVEPSQMSSYIFLCSHKTRDKRCGVTAPIMKKEMDLHLRDLGLYRDHGDDRPGGCSVNFINHIGGHKYAANVIIYLKKSGKNIWLARCRPNNVKPIIDECIVGDGKVWPNKVRLAQKFSPVEW